LGKALRDAAQGTPFGGAAGPVSEFVKGIVKEVVDKLIEELDGIVFSPIAVCHLTNYDTVGKQVESIVKYFSNSADIDIRLRSPRPPNDPLKNAVYWQGESTIPDKPDKGLKDFKATTYWPKSQQDGGRVFVYLSKDDKGYVAALRTEVKKVEVEFVA